MKSQGMSIGDIVRHARSNAPFSIKIEIEVENVDDAVDAMNAGADIVMLDNMRPEAMREAVDRRVGQSLLEASGNVTLANVRQVAETGVDIISVGEANSLSECPRHFARLQRRPRDVNLERLTPSSPPMTIRRIQNERRRTFIDEFNVHHRPEHT